MWRNFVIGKVISPKVNFLTRNDVRKEVSSQRACTWLTESPGRKAHDPASPTESMEYAPISGIHPAQHKEVKDAVLFPAWAWDA